MPACLIRVYKHLNYVFLLYNAEFTCRLHDLSESLNCVFLFVQCPSSAPLFRLYEGGSKNFEPQVQKNMFRPFSFFHGNQWSFLSSCEKNEANLLKFGGFVVAESEGGSDVRPNRQNQV